MSRLVRALILWLVRRTPRTHARRHHVVTFLGDFEFFRFCPFWPDERVRVFSDGTREHSYRPPWWRPFNILLHLWRPRKNEAEPFHDHPRWTVTIVLKGEVIERTPWTVRHLKPGSVVIRSRKAIHSLEPVPGWHGKVWTLFIVGRRDYPQTSFTIVPRGRQ